MPYPPFSLLKSFIYVFVLFLFCLSLLHECNFRIEVAAQLRTSAIISTGVWLKMSNMCLYGVQVQGIIHNIVALVIFFMTRMWCRLLRKRYIMLFVLTNLSRAFLSNYSNFLGPMTWLPTLFILTKKSKILFIYAFWLCIWHLQF